MLMKNMQKNQISKTLKETEEYDLMRSSVISLQPAEDKQFEKYRRTLLQQGIQIQTNAQPELKLVRLNILQNGKILESRTQFEGLRFRLAENQRYELVVEFYVKKAMVYGLTVVNTVNKGFIRVQKETFPQGSYAPMQEIQTAQMHIQTPRGLIGRGDYQATANVKDRQGNTLLSLKYQIQVK